MKKFDKKEWYGFVIAVAIMIFIPVFFGMHYKKLENFYEKIDMANLYAARATGTIDLLTESDIPDGTVLWYNPDKEDFSYTFVVCGRGTKSKISDTDYNDSKYTDVGYDGSDMLLKGIKTTFHSSGENKYCDVKFALANE